MRHEPPDSEEAEKPVEPDVMPEGTVRGGITVPDANDTGITTPPIAGWGDTLSDHPDERREPADD